MSINPEDFTSQSTNWFETNISYEGIGISQFENPSGYIKGMTKVEFNEVGEATVSMEIEDFECDPCLETGVSKDIALIWLLTGHKPQTKPWLQYSLSNLNRTCTSLEVSTENGVFRTIGKIHFDVQELGSRMIKFHVLASEYKSDTEEEAKYWVMPLTNFISNVLTTIWRTPNPLQHHIVDHHPLRIYSAPHVPDNLSVEERREAIYYARRMCGFVPFEFDKELGFVEGISDYRGRAKMLQEGDAKLLITSVMVGKCENKSLNFNEAFEWLPLDNLHLLSLASGSLVGLPWVEFRSESGKLIQRLHTQQWQAYYSRGHSALRNTSRYGIGALLTNAPPDLGSQLRIAIRLIVKGGQDVFDGIDQFTFLVRASDTLTENLRIQSTPPIKVPLDSQDEETVKEILKSAGRQIKELKKENSDNQDEEIERIAQRVFGARTGSSKRPNEGEAITSLVEELELKDFSILPQENWVTLFNKYRNQAIHNSYFPEDGYPITEWYPLQNHLHDLLIRIVLKQLNYNGGYYRAIPIKHDCDSVDWVTTETVYRDLWYTGFLSKDE